MLALTLALTLQGSRPADPPPWQGGAGRVYTSPTLHVGIRPAAHLEVGEVDIGLTVQVTTFALQ